MFSAAESRIEFTRAVVGDVVNSARQESQSWPQTRWQDDPVGFCKKLLGVTLWHKQNEILEAIRDHGRVSVRSGHKIGKSMTAVCAALWFFCSFPDARVIMTSVTASQVNSILWRDLKKVVREAADKRGFVLGAEIAKLANTGVHAPDEREMRGFTAKETEAAAGVSGENVLYLGDEASGIPDEMFEVFEGNRAGGVNAKLVLFSNPTKTTGEFFLSQTAKKGIYHCIHVSSEDTPNVVQGKRVVPGLATREWVDEKRREWGEDSAIYQVRVRGNFARENERTVIGIGIVEEAVARFDDTPPDGRLNLGVDVARYGDDDCAIALRRGKRVLPLIVPQAREYGDGRKGLSEEDLAAAIMQAVRENREPTEVPIVKVDECGTIGTRVCNLLEQYQTSGEIVLVRVNVSRDATDRRHFPKLRDQLWFFAREWLKDGGALPDDSKLAAELIAPTFEWNDKQQRKVESKDEIKKRLKRSPDRADAVNLAIWDPYLWSASNQHHGATEASASNGWDSEDSGDVIDPYRMHGSVYG